MRLNGALAYLRPKIGAQRQRGERAREVTLGLCGTGVPRQADTQPVASETQPKSRARWPGWFLPLRRLSDHTLYYPQRTSRIAVVVACAITASCKPPSERQAGRQPASPSPLSVTDLVVDGKPLATIERDIQLRVSSFEAASAELRSTYASHTVTGQTEQLNCLPGSFAIPACTAALVPVTGVELATVATPMVAARESLLHSLPGDDLAPMRDYINRRVPPAHRIAQWLDPVRTTDGRLLVTENDANLALRRFSNVAASVGKITTWVLDVDWASEPPGARIELYSGHRVLRRTLSTDSKMKQVWRGDYLYTVRREGFKPIVDELLNLVDGTPLRMSCRLIASDSPDDAIPCVPQY
jgi:hypothetical protein